MRNRGLAFGGAVLLGMLGCDELAPPEVAVPSAQPGAASPALAGRQPRDIVTIVGRVRAGRDLTPKSWPGGHRMAAVLTFDFDAELAAHDVGRKAFDGMRIAPQTSAGQFGARRGLPRVLSLLQELDVPATFAIPGLVAKLHPDAVKSIVSAGHEVAFHGYEHEDFRNLATRQQEDKLFDWAQAELAKLGAKPRGFRAPYGRFSGHTLEVVKARGLVWDSSLSADDSRPYELVLSGKRSGVVEVPVSPYLNDWALFGNPTGVGPQTDPNAVFEIWRQELEGAYREGGVFCLIMHPQIIGRHHRLALLRRIIEHAQQKSDVWFARMSELADHVRPR